MRKSTQPSQGGNPGSAGQYADGAWSSADDIAAGDEPEGVDVCDGRVVIGRLIEEPGGIVLLVPAGDRWRRAGRFRSRKAVMTALREAGNGGADGG